MPRQLGMGKIEVRQLKYDLTPVAGLALVGDYFKSSKPVLKLSVHAQVGLVCGRQ